MNTTTAPTTETPYIVRTIASGTPQMHGKHTTYVDVVDGRAAKHNQDETRQWATQVSRPNDATAVELAEFASKVEAAVRQANIEARRINAAHRAGK